MNSLSSASWATYTPWLWFFGTFVLSVCFTRWLIPVLTKRAVMDIPNKRSSHVTPTPRGGGIAVVVSAVGIATVQMFVWDIVFPYIYQTLAAVFILAVISFFDDLKNLPVKPRILAQLVVIVAYVVFLPAESSLIAPYVEPYPLWGMVLERAVMVLTLIWVTNLYNFMDGINGITGTETLSLGLGAGCVCIVAGFWTPDTGLPIFLYPAWFLCAAMAGFLIFNFGKAKIFLGDVGSISTGLAMGSAMIMLSATGYWAAGLILPLYYVVDATYTLFKRYRRGENIFQPHKQHFYQQSTQRGRSHAGTCYWILGCNIGLVVIASASIVVAQQSAGSENANALQARILLSQGGALLLALLWCGVCIRGMLSVDAIQQEDA